MNSGGEYECRADGNNLHFYILDKRTDAQGVLRYKVGVRSLAGAGPQTRGVSLASPQSGTAEGFATCTFPLTNTGAAAATPNVAPAGRIGVPRTATSTACRRRRPAPAGRRTCKNALATAKFGETVQVPVYIEKAAGAAASGSVTLTATSESDPTKTVSATCTTTDGNVGGTVPATLSLTHGHAGQLRRRSRPARRRTTSPPRRRT